MEPKPPPGLTPAQLSEWDRTVLQPFRARRYAEEQEARYGRRPQQPGAFDRPRENLLDNGIFFGGDYSAGAGGPYRRRVAAVPAWRPQSEIQRIGSGALREGALGGTRLNSRSEAPQMDFGNMVASSDTYSVLPPLEYARGGMDELGRMALLGGAEAQMPRQMWQYPAAPDYDAETQAFLRQQQEEQMARMVQGGMGALMGGAWGMPPPPRADNGWLMAQGGMMGGMSYPGFDDMSSTAPEYLGD